MLKRSLMIALVATLPLAGCGGLFGRSTAPLFAAAPPPEGMVRPKARPGEGGASARPPALGAGASRSAEALDRTTAAERAAAVAAPAGGAVLGRVVVSLGSPAEQGFWLRSPLVTAPRDGVVEVAGNTVQVELRPGAGAAQLSLAAFRALGLGLTDLPEVTVRAR